MTTVRIRKEEGFRMVIVKLLLNIFEDLWLFGKIVELNARIQKAYQY